MSQLGGDSGELHLKYLNKTLFYYTQSPYENTAAAPIFIGKFFCNGGVIMKITKFYTTKIWSHTPISLRSLKSAIQESASPF